MIEVRPSPDDNAWLERAWVPRPGPDAPILSVERKYLTALVHAIDAPNDDTKLERVIDLIRRTELIDPQCRYTLLWPARCSEPTWEDAEWR